MGSLFATLVPKGDLGLLVPCKRSNFAWVGEYFASIVLCESTLICSCSNHCFCSEVLRTRTSYLSFIVLKLKCHIKFHCYIFVKKKHISALLPNSSWTIHCNHNFVSFHYTHERNRFVHTTKRHIAISCSVQVLCQYLAYHYHLFCLERKLHCTCTKLEYFTALGSSIRIVSCTRNSRKPSQKYITFIYF